VYGIGTPDMKLWLVCALLNYEWCGGLYFAGAAILSDGCPPQTPRQGRHVILELIKAI